MAIYKYQPYYKYDGATRAEPFREELDLEQQKENIKDFFSEIENYFGSDVKFERQDDNYILITSDISQEDCDERVKRCLNSLDLYANRTPYI
ncbi:hypothetical protein I6E72_03275 [Pseudoalteromonas sp. NSLLW24]|uniref:hypothetical protein n=1 Tax=Pseudoalteromonas sp. NSLLW24 TaxID=2792050 RepID=UPI0018CCF5A6|nr:hypothetical protein [Pseudoalteromonas sp. NSLLW24]MBG9997976.1 hypothetical protein [Pseudoalteromonas sp. NSLLW24]